MTPTALERLALRRDRLILSAKILLPAIVWLVAMAFYDRAADGYPVKSILLTTRTSFLLWNAHIPATGERRIWGGPATLFGAQSLLGTFAAVSGIAFVRAWLNRARVSRIGIAFAAGSIVLGLRVAVAGSIDIYSLAVTPANFATLATAVDAHSPGLIDALKRGERPKLPAAGGSIREVAIEPGLIARPADKGPLVRDRDDVEGLRYALAQQAWLAGDVATVKRLLPISLAIPPTDRPARNDFARRLVEMGAMAGVAPVPVDEQSVVANRATQWKEGLAMIRYMRMVLHLLLWSGLLCLVLGLLVRWSHERIASRAAALADFAARPPRRREVGVTTP